MTVQTIGKYRLAERIGRGGMGSVYRAWDPVLRRDVALKLIAGFDGEPESVRRFEREAQAAARLSHPNIVVVHDFGYHDDTPYLVMEYLTGMGVDRAIREREPVPVVDRLTVILDACRALEHAHARGILHRDIKPANIWITKQGVGKILDFGITRVDGTTATTAGRMFGTPHYLSPEAIRGECLDGRSDIFSLTATLFEWLTFEKAFGAGTLPDVLVRAASEDVCSVAERMPGYSHALISLVQTGLQKTPERRYPDAGAMAEAIEHVIDTERHTAEVFDSPTSADSSTVVRPGTTVHADPRGPRVSHRRLLIGGAAVVGILAIVISIVSVLGMRRPVRSDPAPTPETTALAGDTQRARPSSPAPALSAVSTERPAAKAPRELVGGSAVEPTRLPAAGLKTVPRETEEPLSPTKNETVASVVAAADTSPVDSPRDAVVPIGTTVMVSLTRELRSDRVQVGQEFEAVLDEALEYRGAIVAPRNTPVVGNVDMVGRLPPPDSRPFMLLSLVRIGGQTGVSVRTGGYRVIAPPLKGGTNARSLVIAIGVGAALGALAGGGTGAAVGASAGATAVALTRDAASTEFRIVAPLPFKLAQPLVIRSSGLKENQR